MEEIRGAAEMHIVEATTIMTNSPPIGQGDVSPCLPGWINTICDAFQRGEGYTLSHSAVSALGHTLIGARVRAERLVGQRDRAREEASRLRELLTEIAEYAHHHSTGPAVPDVLWEIRQMAYEIPNARTDEECKQDAGGRY